jgi:hypothetical protein
MGFLKTLKLEIDIITWNKACNPFMCAKIRPETVALNLQQAVK